MTFNPFKKRDNVLDLTKNKTHKPDIPIPSDIKSRIEADIRNSGIQETTSTPITDESTGETVEPKKSGGIGGFFGGFFGGGSSSASSSNSEEDKIASATDFGSNSTESSSTPEPSSTYGYGSGMTSGTKVRLRDLISKISKLSDRIELLERKVERLERK